MTLPNADRKTSDGARFLAVFAVLIMVLSAFAVIGGDSPQASADIAPQTSLEATVVYHACSDDPSVNTVYNFDTASAKKSFTYYGTVISTEYNPQVWEFSKERWFGIKEYSVGNTYMFTGWKFATDGTGTGDSFTPSAFTSVYDPGDVLLYSDGHWYTDSQQVDLAVDSGKIQDRKSVV